MGWLTTALVLLGIAICARPGPEEEERARKALPALVAVVLGMFAEVQLYPGSFGYRPDIAGWLLLSGCIFLYTVRGKAPSLRECRTRILPVIMLGFLLVSIKTIRDNPDPHIDVLIARQAVSDGLMKLRNPYTVTIPNIYPPDSPAYIPLTKNGRSLYGSSYPPINALVDLPAFLLTGDVRYGLVLELLLSCGLIAMMRASWLALCSSVLLLINPFSQAMIKLAWTEPLAILLFCLLLFSVDRYARAVPYLFGLFLSAKQTHLAVLPLAWILIDDPTQWRRVLGFLGKALAVVVAIDLPFFLWNPGAFVFSLITVQLRIPLRLDEISYAAYAARKGWLVLPIWFSFLYLPIGIYLGITRAPRSAAGFALASAVALIPFFAFSKQGAPNYYYFAIAVLCCTLALTNLSVAPSASRTSPDPGPGRA